MPAPPWGHRKAILCPIPSGAAARAGRRSSVASGRAVTCSVVPATRCERIAGAVGVSEGAVRKDITAEEVRTGTHLAPAEVAGQDGKRYPAKRPTIVAALGH